MIEKEQFEMPVAGMPWWIREHVELYLSDPERTHPWDSTVAADLVRCLRSFLSRVE
jgi:hypothetical protein